MENKKAGSDIQELFTVLGIAAAIAGVMNLLALIPPVSILYRRLADRDQRYIWTALVTGVISGVLSFYREKQEEKELLAQGAEN